MTSRTIWATVAGPSSKPRCFTLISPTAKPCPNRVKTHYVWDQRCMSPLSANKRAELEH